MAEVTAFTAARSQAIEDAAITDARLDGTDLILIPHGFDTDPVTYPEINVGNVQGIQGIQGPPAPEQPIGMITMFGGAAAPAGYLLCQGQAVDRTAYADLFAVIGTAFGDGDGSTTFNLPDLQDRFPMGKGAGALGDEGGTADAVVVAHTHNGPSHTHNGPSHTHTGPSHRHTINHDHGSVNTSTAGNHRHEFDDQTTTGDSMFLNTGSGTNIQYRNSATTLLNRLTDYAGDHQHSVNLPNYTGNSGYDGTGATGASGTGATSAAGTGATSSTGVNGTGLNRPPFTAVNFIIKT